MVDRTLYRPREMIAIATQSLEAAQSLKPKERFPIDYATLSEAEVGYSEQRAADVAAEFRFQYPGLLSVFDVFRGRAYTMERDVLEEICFELATGGLLTDKQAAEWVIERDPEELIEDLWGIGFLRARAVGGIKLGGEAGVSIWDRTRSPI